MSPPIRRTNFGAISTTAVVERRCRSAIALWRRRSIPYFIHSDTLTTPFNDRVEEGSNPRRLEVEQIVRLMNVIAEKVFVGQFSHSIGTR